jgi:hypothetical protein
MAPLHLASIFQRLVQWHPEADFPYIWRILAGLSRLASRSTTSVCHILGTWFPGHLWVSFELRSRRRDDWHRDLNLLSNVISRIIYAKYNAMFRCRDHLRHDADRRFASIVPYVIPRLLLASFLIVSRRTFGFGLPALCLIVSLG